MTRRELGRRCTAVCALMLLPVLLPAQEGGRQGTEVIEIRGQVPTPQVVTVRPRAIPEFAPERRVAGTYDPGREPLALPAAEVVRSLLGEPALDEAPAAVAAGPPPPLLSGDSAARAAGDGGVGRGAPRGEVLPTPADAAEEERQREIAAIRAELERRRARLDSLAEEVRRLGEPEQERRRPRPTPTPDQRSEAAPGTSLTAARRAVP